MTTVKVIFSHHFYESVCWLVKYRMFKNKIIIFIRVKHIFVKDRIGLPLDFCTKCTRHSNENNQKIQFALWTCKFRSYLLHVLRPANFPKMATRVNRLLIQYNLRLITLHGILNVYLGTMQKVSPNSDCLFVYTASTPK